MNKGSQSQSDSNWGNKHENSAVKWQEINANMHIKYTPSIPTHTLLQHMFTDTLAYSENSIVSKIWSNQHLGHVWIALFEHIYLHKHLQNYLEEFIKITYKMFIGCFQLISISSP
jgi:hypothetical protein